MPRACSRCSAPAKVARRFSRTSRPTKLTTTSSGLNPLRARQACERLAGSNLELSMPRVHSRMSKVAPDALSASAIDSEGT